MLYATMNGVHVASGSIVQPPCQKVILDTAGLQEGGLPATVEFRDQTWWCTFASGLASETGPTSPVFEMH